MIFSMRLLMMAHSRLGRVGVRPQFIQAGLIDCTLGQLNWAAMQLIIGSIPRSLRDLHREVLSNPEESKVKEGMDISP